MSPISASSFSRNNITYSIRTWYKRIPPKIYTTVNTYAYNEYGYPVKCFVEYSVSEDVIVSKDTSTMFYEYFE